MDGALVVQRHDSQHPPVEFFDNPPESVPIVFLGLHFYRILNDPDTPFLPQIRTLPQNFLFEVRREFEAIHALSSLAAFMGTRKAGSSPRPAEPPRSLKGPTRYKGNRFFVVSDNNDLFVQRTLLLYFELVER